MITKIKKELNSYFNESVELFEGHSFSAYKMIRRIALYKNQIYPTGKIDSQGNYKYWFDIIIPRKNSEIKNIDFDTKDIILYSDTTKQDIGKLIIANASLREWLTTTAQGEKLNEAVERGTEWGNLVWKKVKGDYKLMDLTSFYVLNQTAETLDDSDVIEMEIMTSVDLRQRKDVWENVQELLESAKEQTSPKFYIYERNGEVSEKEYNEAKKIDKAGSEDKYFLAKIIVGGTQKNQPSQILFVDKIPNKSFYKEYHRSTYSGVWLRVGIYQLLMDVQTRANEIGNQIARGLEWASKTVFRSSDKVIAQNILTDLSNGDVIKSNDLQQVETRMQGLDQLIADWNRNIQLADQLANSFEVVTGESLPSGAPFRLGALLNVNATKLFDFIREKLGLTLQDVIEDWILPQVLKDLKLKKILELTADSGQLSQYYKLLIDEWYIQNLVSFPPHTAEIGEEIKNEKLEELKKNKSVMVDLEKGLWEGFKPRAKVLITGENFNIASDLETLSTFISLEADPVRRTALIELAMAKKNIDASQLPKSPPMPQPMPEQVATRPATKQAPNQLDRILASK